jgi:flagellin-like protein
MDVKDMKKVFKSKKAVSPVIATVLMILVTMIGMTLLFAFVSSYSENYKAGVGSSVMESITVEDIWLLNSTSKDYNNSVILQLYNVGKVDVKINSLYVDGLRLQTGFDPKEPIEVGERASISATSISNWNSRVTYTFRIVTESGSKFEVKYTAP